ncbi:MAG: hypothetical protein ACK5P0_01950 [bacterium]
MKATKNQLTAMIEKANFYMNESAYLQPRFEAEKQQGRNFSIKLAQHIEFMELYINTPFSIIEASMNCLTLANRKFK